MNSDYFWKFFLNKIGEEIDFRQLQTTIIHSIHSDYKLGCYVQTKNFKNSCQLIISLGAKEFRFMFYYIHGTIKIEKINYILENSF